MKPVACWHHGEIARLECCLRHNCIDLWGKQEVTEKGTNKLDHWWKKMGLKEGDRIQIVAKGTVCYTAAIAGPPEDSPRGHPPWQSKVLLKDIVQIKPPKAARCSHLQGSHRFDGPKTRSLMTLD